MRKRKEGEGVRGGKRSRERMEERGKKFREKHEGEIEKRRRESGVMKDRGRGEREAREREKSVEEEKKDGMKGQRKRK